MGAGIYGRGVIARAKKCVYDPEGFEGRREKIPAVSLTLEGERVEIWYMLEQVESFAAGLLIMCEQQREEMRDT